MGNAHSASAMLPPPLDTSLSDVGVTLGFVFMSYLFTYVVYNLYFHPLARFPGPWLARASLLWRIYHSMGGRFHRSIQRQHEIYGKVFRVSPNEISFSSVKSWKGIYGPWPNGTSPFIKSPFYDMYGAGFGTGCIGSERSPASHARMKRTLLPAFSARACADQEHILQNCVDGFIARIGELGSDCKGLNMTEWYEMLAFDVLGEMAFGDSFHCVENAEPHFWQQMITKHLFAITVVDNLRRYPALRWLGQRMLPAATVEVQRRHTGYSRAKVASRLKSETNRKDFLTNVVDKVAKGEVSQEELTAHASTLVIAGGETVATALAAITYYLCKNPPVMDKLRATIRGTFSTYEAIESSAVLQIPYLQAVIQEGLRIYPPGSQGFPRVSPGAEVDGEWVPAGTELYTSAWTVTHDRANFSRPYDFHPERWLEADSSDIREASQPFSLGPRGCIGRNFAYMEMSLILAKLHFRYDMELVNRDLDWEGRSHIHVMWWKPELRVAFTPRKED